jgi:hypothetical protein
MCLHCNSLSLKIDISEVRQREGFLKSTFFDLENLMEVTATIINKMFSLLLKYAKYFERSMR